MSIDCSVNGNQKSRKGVKANIEPSERVMSDFGGIGSGGESDHYFSQEEPDDEENHQDLLVGKSLTVPAINHALGAQVSPP